MSRRCVTADEYDAYTGWRKLIRWQRGELAAIKRRTSKRERKDAKREIRDARYQ